MWPTSAVKLNCLPGSMPAMIAATILQPDVMISCLYGGGGNCFAASEATATQDSDLDSGLPFASIAGCSNPI